MTRGLHSLSHCCNWPLQSDTLPPDFSASPVGPWLVLHSLQPSVTKTHPRQNVCTSIWASPHKEFTTNNMSGCFDLWCLISAVLDLWQAGYKHLCPAWMPYTCGTSVRAPCYAWVLNLHTYIHIWHLQTNCFDLQGLIGAVLVQLVEWGTCALRHRGRRGRESQCKACLGGIAFCGQFLCFAFQSFRHRSAVFLNKVLHKSEVLVRV